MRAHGSAGGYTLGLGHVVPQPSHPPRSHPSQTYACCSSTLSRDKDYVKPVPCNVHRFTAG